MNAHRRFFEHVDANRYTEALMEPGLGHHVHAPRKPGDPHVCHLITDLGTMTGEGSTAMQALRNAASRFRHALRGATR